MFTAPAWLACVRSWCFTIGTAWETGQVGMREATLDVEGGGVGVTGVGPDLDLKTFAVVLVGVGLELVMARKC